MILVLKVSSPGQQHLHHLGTLEKGKMLGPHSGLTELEYLGMGSSQGF